jgi:hypothetical protein
VFFKWLVLNNIWKCLNLHNKRCLKYDKVVLLFEWEVREMDENIFSVVQNNKENI